MRRCLKAADSGISPGVFPFRGLQHWTSTTYLLVATVRVNKGVSVRPGRRWGLVHGKGASGHWDGFFAGSWVIALEDALEGRSWAGLRHCHGCSRLHQSLSL